MKGAEFEVARLTKLLWDNGICPHRDRNGRHEVYYDGSKCSCRACGHVWSPDGCKYCGRPTFGGICAKCKEGNQ